MPSRVGEAPLFFLRGGSAEGAVTDAVDGIMSWYPARTSTARQPMAAPSFNFEITGAVMFFAEVNSEAQTNG